MHRRAAIALLGFITSGCASLQSISPPDMLAYELSLATNGDDMMVAWHGGYGDTDIIYVEPLNHAGLPAAQPIAITDGQRFAYEPDLQLIGSDMVLAWYEKDKTTRETTAWVARLDRTGHEIWRRQLSGASGLARNAVVRHADHRVYTAWIEGADEGDIAVWTQTLSDDGAPLTSARRAASAGSTTWNLNAAIGPGERFYVVYDAQLGSRASELQLLTISDAEIRHDTISPDDGYASTYPDIGFDHAGTLALTWFDNRDGNAEVYLTIGSLHDIRSGAASPKRITHTQADSIGAYLAWNGERLGLVWCDAEYRQQEIFSQLFDARGRSYGPPARLTRTPTQSSIPSIRPWGAGFAIAWNEYKMATDGHSGISSSVATLSWLR